MSIGIKNGAGRKGRFSSVIGYKTPYGPAFGHGCSITGRRRARLFPAPRGPITGATTARTRPAPWPITAAPCPTPRFGRARPGRPCTRTGARTRRCPCSWITGSSPVTTGGGWHGRARRGLGGPAFRQPIGVRRQFASRSAHAYFFRRLRVGMIISSGNRRQDSRSDKKQAGRYGGDTAIRGGAIPEDKGAA